MGNFTCDRVHILAATGLFGVYLLVNTNDITYVFIFYPIMSINKLGKKFYIYNVEKFWEFFLFSL